MHFDFYIFLTPKILKPYSQSRDVKKKGARKHLWVALSIALLLASLYALRESGILDIAHKGDRFLVSKVIDGDTIVIDDGRRVRYLGIDTPEIGEPYYRIAKDRNASLVLNRYVRLKVCEESHYDRYGRLLAWVYTEDGRMVNKELVKDGLARVYVIPPCGVEKEGVLREVEKEAKKEGRGIWSLTLKPITPEEAGAHIGEYRKVRGRVLSTYNSGRAIYLNFGRDFKRDFTVVIFKRDLKNFLDSGIDPENDYRRKEIEVTGRIGEYNGPEIIARGPDQIKPIKRD